MSFQTLTQALDHNASDSNSITYLRANKEESNVTFKELRSRALGILFNLQRNNIKPGNQLIILTENNEFFLDAFWAGLYGGIIPVPVAAASNDEHRLKLIRIFKQLETPWLYTDAKTMDKLQAFCLANDMATEAGQLMQQAILIDDIEDVSQAGEIQPLTQDDIAFIQFSSGSTSDPKGVVLTHKNLITNINAIIVGARLTTQDRMLSWMPLTHDMGMIGFHLSPVVTGFDHTIMDTSVFVRRPLLWITTASEQKSTLLCSPNFGYKHFLKVYESKGIEPVDLSNIRAIFNGAEPISLDICKQFLTALEKHKLPADIMVPVYGLAEASLAVTFSPMETPIESIKLDRHQLSVGDTVKLADDDNAIEFVFTGTPVNDCYVRITDFDNNVLNENFVGKIQLKGDNITKGYYHAEDINKQLITEDGWLDTGDSGAFINGKLIITGRLKDIIFVNGLNYYSHDLENILHGLDQLELGKVVATGARKANSSEDELIIFILHRADLETFLPLVSNIRKTINETTGIEVHQVIAVKRIPKTTSGKVQRHLLNEEYLSGDYDEQIKQIKELVEQSNIHSSNDNDNASDTAIQILQICNSAVSDKDIKLNDNLFEIGISSLALADIHEQIEVQFPGKVEISDLFDNPTVLELAEFLQAKQ